MSSRENWKNITENNLGERGGSLILRKIHNYVIANLAVTEYNKDRKV